MRVVVEVGGGGREGGRVGGRRGGGSVVSGALLGIQARGGRDEKGNCNLCVVVNYRIMANGEEMNVKMRME